MIPILHRPARHAEGWPTPWPTAAKHGATRRALERIDDGLALHDRAIPGGRARIDHVVIGHGAVWVVDSRRYAGQTVAVGAGRLVVGGVDATALADAAARRADIVAVAAAAVLGTEAVRPVLCFEDAAWAAEAPGPWAVGPVVVADPSHLAALIGAGGAIDDRAARRIAAVVGHALPAAGA